MINSYGTIWSAGLSAGGDASAGTTPSGAIDYARENFNIGESTSDIVGAYEASIQKNNNEAKPMTAYIQIRAAAGARLIQMAYKDTFKQCFDQTQKIDVPTYSGAAKDEDAPTGAIIGGVIGGIVVVGAISGVVVLVVMKKKAAAAAAASQAPMQVPGGNNLATGLNSQPQGQFYQQNPYNQPPTHYPQKSHGGGIDLDDVL